MPQQHDSRGGRRPWPSVVGGQARGAILGSIGTHNLWHRLCPPSASLLKKAWPHRRRRNALAHAVWNGHDNICLRLLLNPKTCPHEPFNQDHAQCFEKSEQVDYAKHPNIACMRDLLVAPETSYSQWIQVAKGSPKCQGRKFRCREMSLRQTQNNSIQNRRAWADMDTKHEIRKTKTKTKTN